MAGFQPLDCIVFASRDPVSLLIAAAEQLQQGVHTWTHIGLLVNREVLSACPTDGWYLWDAYLSATAMGSRLQPLETSVLEYQRTLPHAQIGWAKLNRNPWVTQPDATRQTVQRVYEQLSPQSYDCFCCACTVFPCLRWCRDQTDLGRRVSQNSMFCSELVATVYQALGVVEGEPANYTPMSFFLQNVLTESTTILM